MPRRRTVEPIDEPILTTVGLLLEAHFGLTRELERRLDRDAGLSVQWFEVLLRLARTPGHRLRMSDLAAQSTLTPSGLTRAVDRLTEAGLVCREACPDDGRVSYATLTDEGRDRIVAALPVHLRNIDEVLGGALGTDDLELLTDLLRKLRDAVHPGGKAPA